MSDNKTPQRYRAFISYSHKDERQATWLQRALESYGLPKQLIGRTTSEGKLSKKFGKVFRDRTDLSVAPDLAEQLQGTLGQCRHLLVVCSPAAAQSKWVNEEILYFKRHYGETRILALIVDGEPFASLIGEPARECFPPALRFRLNHDGSLSQKPAEPLASDLRPQGDGKRMALLKLAAAMLGVGLDELVQRDQQRRLRIQKFITTAALVAVTVLSSLTYMAISARDLAEHRRLAAEDLINFMLTDLRDKLEPVGRLDVLDVVGEKVLSFYAIQDKALLPPDALSRQSAAMHLLGEIRDLSGDTDAAVSLFAAAAQTTAELLAREPDNPQRIFDHAQSVFWVGYPDYQRGKYAEARIWFDQYQALARRLVALEPEKAAWQMELFYALNTQAVMMFRGGEYQNSLDLFLEADIILSGLPDGQERRSELINNLAWRGSAHFMLGDFDGAISSRLTELELIHQWLSEEPDRHNLFDHSMTAHTELVKLFQRTGDVASLEKYRQAGLKTAENLLALDPSNRDYQLRAQKFYVLNALVADISPEGEARLLRDVITLSEQMPDRFEAQELRWGADISLGIKGYSASRHEQLLNTAQEFSHWTAESKELGQDNRLQSLRMLTNLLLATKADIGASERISRINISRKILAESGNFLDYRVHCGDDAFQELIGEQPVLNRSLIKVARTCLGLGEFGDVLNLSQGESYE